MTTLEGIPYLGPAEYLTKPGYLANLFEPFEKPFLWGQNLQSRNPLSALLSYING